MFFVGFVLLSVCHHIFLLLESAVVFACGHGSKRKPLFGEKAGVGSSSFLLFYQLFLFTLFSSTALLGFDSLLVCVMVFLCFL